MKTTKRQWSLRADLEQPRSATATLRSMQVGQHVIAAALAIIGVARATAEGTPVLAAVGAAAVLLLWYGAGILLSPRPTGVAAARWWLVVLTLIWAGSVIISAEFVWFAFVLWLLAGQLLTRRASVVFSALVFVAVALAPVAHSGSTSYANVFGPLIGGIFALGVSLGYLELRRDARERELLVESLQLAHQEMAGLQEELALTQRHSGAIEERTRLSRDIHDTIAQGLSSIALLVRAELEQDPGLDTTQTLRQVEALAGDSLVDVRRIVAELTPSELEDNALAAALTRMLRRFEEETGVSTILHVDDTLPVLPTAQEVALLRTAQSALANVRLHSGASKVVISLIDADDSVRLDIVDDGCGFDLTTLRSTHRSTNSSYGLIFMRDRLRERGGGLDIESAPGEGTALSGHLPVAERRTR